MTIKLSDHFTYKKLLRFVFPSIIMMVFTSVYGVVDGLFVSNFVGKNAFAAINLVMPFVMILGGMGFMIGTGGTALVSKVLGEGDRVKANRYFTMMVEFTLLLGVILSVLGVVFMRPVAYFLGATDDIINDCVVYGRIVVGFTFSFMLQNVFQSFFIAAEKPKLGLYTTVAAGLANIILDWLFIAVFNMGVAGAAFATGISQCIGGVLPLFYFALPNSSLLSFVKTGLQLRPILRSVANGSSELMNNISSSIVSIIYNFQLLKFAGVNGISAYGVLMYVQFIFIAVFIGYTIGSAPIIGYNYGASNSAELKNILKKSTLLMFSSGIALAILAICTSGLLARIFVGYDAELFEMTKKAFAIFSVSFVFAGFNIFASSFFTALNNGMVSAVISFLRTLIFQTSSVLILPIFLEVDGIWWSNSVAEICALIISVIFLFAMRKRYKYM
ncbi:MAG: MATE family efflux transporter [Ruminococcaceae bacterium]|nr:MATE family efflux transporter [Oscillospiraceae bacterium]